MLAFPHQFLPKLKWAVGGKVKVGFMGKSVFALALIWPPVVFSEEGGMLGSEVIDDLTFLKEEELVYTAIRYMQPISKAPSNIYVITAEDIQHSGATDIPTILRRVPGMEVIQTTAAEYNVSVRGDNQLVANKLLVQIDGRSIYLDAAGNVFWRLIPITLTEIERIEMLKGPASAIHGFNAFDGVVNIITKPTLRREQATIQAAGGELGTLDRLLLMEN